jgi:hypothetical protein
MRTSQRERNPKICLSQILGPRKPADGPPIPNKLQWSATIFSKLIQKFKESNITVPQTHHSVLHEQINKKYLYYYNTTNTTKRSTTEALLIQSIYSIVYKSIYETTDAYKVEQEALRRIKEEDWESAVRKKMAEIRDAKKTFENLSVDTNLLKPYETFP